MNCLTFVGLEGFELLAAEAECGVLATQFVAVLEVRDARLSGHAEPLLPDRQRLLQRHELSDGLAIAVVGAAVLKAYVHLPHAELRIAAQFLPRMLVDLNEVRGFFLLNFAHYRMPGLPDLKLLWRGDRCQLQGDFDLRVWPRDRRDIGQNGASAVLGLLNDGGAAN